MAYGMLMAGMGLLIIILIYYVHSYKGQIAKAAVSKSGLAGGAPYALTSANHHMVEQEQKNVGGSSTNRGDDAIYVPGFYLNQYGDMVPAGANRAIHSPMAGTKCPRWSSGAKAEASALAEVGQFQFDDYDGEARLQSAVDRGDHNIGTASQIAQWAAKDDAAYAAAKKSGAAQQKTDLLSDEALHASMQGM